MNSLVLNQCLAEKMSLNGISVEKTPRFLLFIP